MESKASPTEPETWQAYLREQIPLCAAMGLGVDTISTERVVLFAPLPPNLNHQGFGFGGSIVSLGLVAGWSLIRYRLNQESIAGDLVIYREVTHFKKPVRSDMSAVCTLDDPGKWNAFLSLLKEHGMAKLRLEPVVLSAGNRVATVKGDYVAVSSEKR